MNEVCMIIEMIGIFDKYLLQSPEVVILTTSNYMGCLFLK